MTGELAMVAGAAVTLAIRLAPEAWLRGRSPPEFLARALPWLPIVVCGVLVATLHVGAPADDRVAYLIAAIPAAATLLWRRSFYLPIVAGAATLAILRAAGRA